MPLQIVEKDAQHILNLCAKYLARDSTSIRHNFNNMYSSGDPRETIAEAWRFPVVESYWDGDADTSYLYDSVTFVWDTLRFPASSVGLITNLTELYHVEPLRSVPFAGTASAGFSLSPSASPRVRSLSTAFRSTARSGLTPSTRRQQGWTTG